MNIEVIVERLKGILFDPENEWKQIRTEQRSNKELLLFYVLPFTAVAAIISFMVVWMNTYLGFWLAFKFAVLRLIMPLVSIVVTAVILNELADTFDSAKNTNNAFKLVVYSYTPALLAAVIVSLSWTLGWVSLFGLYGVYLLWVGLPIMMDTPEDKRLVYIIAVVAIVLIINAVLSALFGVERLAYY